MTSSKVRNRSRGRVWVMQNKTGLGFKQKVNYNVNYKLHGIAVDTSQ